MVTALANVLMIPSKINKKEKKIRWREIYNGEHKLYQARDIECITTN